MSFEGDFSKEAMEILTEGRVKRTYPKGKAFQNYTVPLFRKEGRYTKKFKRLIARGMKMVAHTDYIRG